VTRIVIATCVFAGATAIPLALEVLWRSDNDPGTHFQPEVGVIEHAGQALAKGKDPYHEVTNTHGKVVYHSPGVSVVNTFNPYLPFMDAFGIPSEEKHDVGPRGVTLCRWWTSSSWPWCWPSADNHSPRGWSWASCRP
jgi:hypothetical protein